MHNDADKSHERVEDAAKQSEHVEDLDVAENESEDVKGGAEPVHNYSFKQAWPKKYSG